MHSPFFLYVRHFFSDFSSAQGGAVQPYSSHVRRQSEPFCVGTPSSFVQPLSECGFFRSFLHDFALRRSRHPPFATSTVQVYDFDGSSRPHESGHIWRVFDFAQLPFELPWTSFAHPSGELTSLHQSGGYLIAAAALRSARKIARGIALWWPL